MMSLNKTQSAADRACAEFIWEDDDVIWGSAGGGASAGERSEGDGNRRRRAGEKLTGLIINRTVLIELEMP